MQRLSFPRLLLLLLLLPAGTLQAEEQPNHIDFATWFQSDIRDTPECELTYRDGRYDFGPNVTNPALSCPDSFAWKLFTHVVRAGFWENWSSDKQTWPSDPWPRCGNGNTATNCCAALESSNESQPVHCPVFPGATSGVPEHILETPAMAHSLPMAMAARGAVSGLWSEVPDSLKAVVIGDLQKELVHRNQPMMDYIFDRQMYHVEGLKAVYQAHTEKLGTYAPYRPKILDPDGTFGQPQVTAFVEFPISSIVVKSNWMSLENARNAGLDPDNPDHPYIKMDLVPKPDGADSHSRSLKAEPHILIAFHIVSKDLPNWFWSTFEHAANPGRCDWTGCNDSFGHASITAPQVDSEGLQGPAANYVPPHQLKKIGDNRAAVFDLAKTYADDDRITPALGNLLAATQIADAPQINRSGRPAPQDKAWRSYRLKGSQTGFVSSTGRPTLLGNSVTEAGLVNSSSCISCHARAAIDAHGQLPLGMRVSHLNHVGISESATGTPEEAWFYVNAYYGVNGENQATAVRSVQADFVFGFRNACPVSESSVGPAHCAKVMKK